MSQTSSNQDDVIQIPESFSELFQKWRYKVYWGGRGAGRSWNFARALIMMGAERKLRILCARELQASLADSVHKLLSDQIWLMGYSSHYHITRESIVGKNGTEFLFDGLRHNTNKIKSTEGVDICWVEEADVVTDASWKVLIPTIRKAGSEIWVSFNTRFKTDATYKRFIVKENRPPDALVKKVSWRDNPWFPEELRIEKDHLYATDYEDYLHVWEGELKVYAEGAIYAKQLQTIRKRGQVCQIPIEAALVVNTYWDLGHNDETAIWFEQQVGPQRRFIDYYENRLMDIEHYARVLAERDYLYGRHYMPHDIQIKVLGMPKSRYELFIDAGVSPIITVPKIPSKNEGIDLTRAAMMAAWFDKDRCERGLECLSNYQYIYDENEDTYRLVPHHNWASNGADAFRTFGQTYKGGYIPPAERDDNPLSRRAARKRRRHNQSDSHIV